MARSTVNSPGIQDGITNEEAYYIIDLEESAKK